MCNMFIFLYELAQRHLQVTGLTVISCFGFYAYGNHYILPKNSLIQRFSANMYSQISEIFNFYATQNSEKWQFEIGFLLMRNIFNPNS